MKSKNIVQKPIRSRRADTAPKRLAEASAGKPRDPLPDALSAVALIKALRGSLKGRPSLVVALQRERRKDERAKTRKFLAMDASTAKLRSSTSGADSQKNEWESARALDPDGVIALHK